MKKHLFVVGMMAAALLSSCSSSKDFVYLNDMKVGEQYTFSAKHEAVVHRDDRLNITVSCKTPELAIPFNIQSGNVQVSADVQYGQVKNPLPRDIVSTRTETSFSPCWANCMWRE